MSIKKLVFLGAGHAHLYALKAFKESPRIDTDIHLITPYDHVVYSGMVPGMVAGHYSVDDCTISIPHLLDKSAIKITYATCTGIDTVAQRVRLSNGTLLQDSCVRMDGQQLYLASGASLACDVPVLTIGGHAPRWLADSGLDLDERGYVSVNAMQQSTSHPNVFAAGDVASRVDTPHAKSGVFAVRAGAALHHNLRATLLQQPKSHPLKAHPIALRTLNLISRGNKSAIASWGASWGTFPRGLTLQGHWVWRWKDLIDHRWMRLYKV